MGDGGGGDNAQESKPFFIIYTTSVDMFQFNNVTVPYIQQLL
jgi:hypothetical protein